MRSVLGWLLLFLIPATASIADSTTSIDAQAVLQRVAERARTVVSGTEVPTGAFRKLSIGEFLDGKGTVRRVTEKVYEVTLQRGMAENRLVALNGRRLEGAESAVRTQQERRWRATYTEGMDGSPLDRMDQFVNERLFGRFEFSIEGQEEIRGHPCVVIGFRPRGGALPEERLIDRVINLLRGRIWVAQDEDEIARVEAQTEGTMKLWGGILGRLEEFRLRLDRERGAPGVWFNRRLDAVIRARRLFTPIHFRLREVGSEFRAVAAPE